MITLSGVEVKISPANVASGNPGYYAAQAGPNGCWQGGILQATATAWETVKAGFATTFAVPDGSATYAALVHAADTAPTLTNVGFAPFAPKFVVQGHDYIFLIKATTATLYSATTVYVQKWNKTGKDMVADDLVESVSFTIDSDDLKSVWADASDNLYLLSSLHRTVAGAVIISGCYYERVIETATYTETSATIRLMTGYDPIRGPVLVTNGAVRDATYQTLSLRFIEQSMLPNAVTSWSCVLSANADLSDPISGTEYDPETPGGTERWWNYASISNGTYYCQCTADGVDGPVYSFPVTNDAYPDLTDLGGESEYTGHYFYPFPTSYVPSYSSDGSIVATWESDDADGNYDNNYLTRLARDDTLQMFDLGADVGDAEPHSLMYDGKCYIACSTTPEQVYVMGTTLTTVTFSDASVTTLGNFPRLLLEGTTVYLLSRATFDDATQGFVKVSVSTSGFGTPSTWSSANQHIFQPQVSNDGNYIYYPAKGDDGLTYFFRLGKAAQSNAIWYMGI